MPEITVAAPPNTNDVAQQLLSAMAALSGVLTDYNAGSQIRTISESVGAVVEQQSVAAQARALQALVYSAMTLFGITAGQAVASSGNVKFYTGAPATQAIDIPANTIVQTGGGIQFITTAAANYPAGATELTVPVQALVAGTTGNVPANSVTLLITGLAYPLSVTNVAPISGGTNAESPSSALSRLAAAVAALGLGSPVSVANAAIGVSVSGETVRYSTCYEPWLAAGSGAGSGTAGFSVYIDNGAGTASSGLIAAVQTTLNGNQASGEKGYRPSGVPYSVQAVSPVYANVSIGATLSSLAVSATVSGALATAVSGYFDLLQFCQSSANYAYQGALAAAVSNAALGLLTSISVSLYYTSASGVAVTVVSGLPYQRVILSALTVAVS